MLLAASMWPMVGGLIVLVVLALVIWRFWPAAGGAVSGDPALARPRKLLKAGDWQSALALLKSRPTSVAADPLATRRWIQFEGECLYVASEQALDAGRYAEALEHLKAAGERIGLAPEECVKRVVEVMLAQLRRRVADDLADAELPPLANQILTLQPDQPETKFWLALAQIKWGQKDKAKANLVSSFEASGKQAAEPALYLGALHLSAGDQKESLRWLGSANKAAPNCPIVGWQLGQTLLESGGDPLLAVKALQKATDPGGLQKFKNDPRRMWTESLPAGSWLGGLSRRVLVPCPLGLDNLAGALAAARMALALALERSDHPSEAAAAYKQLFAAGNVSVVVRRGLGLALAKTGKFEEARPHLEAVHQAEPLPITAGYLALCTARSGQGEPAKNLADGLAMLTKQKVHGDAGWARLAGDLFAAARLANVTPDPATARELATIFASVEATDPVAAAAYALAADQAMPTWGRLYLRSAQLHGIRSPNELGLLDKTFADRAGLHNYFKLRDWDIDAAERLYLERSAEQRPGVYPTAPGPGYATIAEAMLLSESRRHETQGRPEEARTVGELALKLGPTRPATLDRVAELCFRRSDLKRAIDLLALWCELAPRDPRPRARLAALYQRAGQPAEALALATAAIEFASPQDQLPLALLAARCAIASDHKEAAKTSLQLCRDLDADNPAPLVALAALNWVAGQHTEMPAMAQAMTQVMAEEPTFFLLRAAGHYLHGEWRPAQIAAEHAMADADMVGEANLIDGLSLLGEREFELAGESLDKAADKDGPVREHARALRGILGWQTGDFAAAVKNWLQLSPDRQKSWNIDRLIPKAAHLAGVAALRAGNDADAAGSFDLAKKLGHDDPQLDQLTSLARTRAARRAEGKKPDAAALDQAAQSVAAGNAPAGLAAWLARAYRQTDRLNDCRKLLERSPQPSPDVVMQRGLLALADGQLASAEQCFVAIDLAQVEPPMQHAVVANLLLTRLSLGHVDGHDDLIQAAIDTAQNSDDRAWFEVLQWALLPEPPHRDVDDKTEQRLVAFGLCLGRFEPMARIGQALRMARPTSRAVRTLAEEVRTLAVKHHLDLNDPEAAWAVVPDSERGTAGPALRVLLGVAACLRQDYLAAIDLFQNGAESDARLQQNMAIAREWNGQPDKAVVHWRRYLENALKQCPAPGQNAEYTKGLIKLVRERLPAKKEPK